MHNFFLFVIGLTLISIGVHMGDVAENIKRIDSGLSEISQKLHVEAGSKVECR